MCIGRLGAKYHFISCAERNEYFGQRRKALWHQNLWHNWASGGVNPIPADFVLVTSISKNEAFMFIFGTPALRVSSPESAVSGSTSVSLVPASLCSQARRLCYGLLNRIMGVLWATIEMVSRAAFSTAISHFGSEGLNEKMIPRELFMTAPSPSPRKAGARSLTAAP
jgi:hypothetical protein